MKKDRNMKVRLLPWIISIVFLIFILTRLTEHEQIAHALSKSKWEWIVLALLFQCGFFLTIAKLYQLSFRLVGVRRPFRKSLKLFFAGMFMNSITPSFGMAGATVYMKQARVEKHSVMRAVAGFLTETLFQQVGFLVILILNLFVLMRNGNMIGETEIFIVTGIVIMIVVQIMFFIVSWLMPRTFGRFLHIFSFVGNWVSKRIRKKTIVSNKWSDNSASEMKAVVSEMIKKKGLFLACVGLGVGMEVFLLAMFQSLFFAFGEGLNFPAAVSGYVSGNVANSVLLGPYGVGVVEAGITLILTHYGIARGAAMLVAVVFRGYSFWIPFVLGFFSLRAANL